MYSFFEGASLKVAKNLIRVTGVRESLSLFMEKNISNTASEELLKIVLALNACNLNQTMKEDFVAKEISDLDRQDIVDDYVVENLREQDWIPIKDGGERMDKGMEILDVAEKLQVHWINEEDTNGPGPRYYCVKDVLRRLGNEKNFDLHDSLFEFIYLQHKQFIDYFRQLLDPEPMEEEVPAITEPPVEAPVETQENTEFHLDN